LYNKAGKNAIILFNLYRGDIYEPTGKKEFQKNSQEKKEI
jgi:hypothetical protein